MPGCFRFWKNRIYEALKKEKRMIDIKDKEKCPSIGRNRTICGESRFHAILLGD